MYCKEYALDVNIEYSVEILLCRFLHGLAVSYARIGEDDIQRPKTLLDDRIQRINILEACRVALKNNVAFAQKFFCCIKPHLIPSSNCDAGTLSGKGFGRCHPYTAATARDQGKLACKSFHSDSLHRCAKRRSLDCYAYFNLSVMSESGT